MEEDNKLANLINPPFQFKLGDKDYLVKKANIEQVIAYQQKLSEIKSDDSILDSVKDMKILSYCLWLILKEADSTITEDYILKTYPGGVDVLEVLTLLGFIDPQKMEITKVLQEKLKNQLTSGGSLPT